jgi:hypothetical protein
LGVGFHGDSDPVRLRPDINTGSVQVDGVQLCGKLLFGGGFGALVFGHGSLHNERKEGETAAAEGGAAVIEAIFPTGSGRSPSPTRAPQSSPDQTPKARAHSTTAKPVSCNALPETG